MIQMICGWQTTTTYTEGGIGWKVRKITFTITFFKHFFKKNFPSELNTISKKALIIEDIRFKNWGILNNYSMSVCLIWFGYHRSRIANFWWILNFPDDMQLIYFKGKKVTQILIKKKITSDWHIGSNISICVPIHPTKKMNNLTCPLL